MEDLKAIGLRVMHANIRITDKTYSRPSDAEVHLRVENLSKVGKAEQEHLEAAFRLFEQPSGFTVRHAPDSVCGLFRIHCATCAGSCSFLGFQTCVDHFIFCL